MRCLLIIPNVTYTNKRITKADIDPVNYEFFLRIFPDAIG